MDVTLAAAAEELSPASRTYAVDVWRRLVRTPGAMAGLAVVSVLVLCAVFAPLIAHTDPLAQNLAQQSLAPSAQHWFGTDKLGRDLFSRIVFGARISIRIGVLAVGIAITAGTILGVTAGFFGGAVENVIMGAVDVLLAFPSIILAIAIATVLGPSIDHLMIAIAVVYVPQYARLSRASVLQVKGLDYIEAARAIGASRRRIIWRHILPNILAPLLVQATLGIATATLEAAGLSYLGLGARPPTPEWGAMLNDARDYWMQSPWALIFPGIAITLTVLGFNLLGDGIRDALDPTQADR
ncbi:MAG TPA: nickel transporter permease [Verrucomicrobiae bacterium]|nr:nickel transporter permease [Verrucomicrobiae bacterium]